jgi:GNAT superfamily N-acetyltransferase
MTDITFQFSQLTIKDALQEDLYYILMLQKRAFVQEAEVNGGDYNLIPIQQTYASILNDFKKYTYLKVVVDGRIIGAVRGHECDGCCYIGRLVIEPIFQGLGLGTVVLNAIEERFNTCLYYELFTGAKSLGNIVFYKKRGYVIMRTIKDESETELVILRKDNSTLS